MTLSVLSALARLGMDPWQEAGRLATLPRAAAVDGLARLLDSMPTGLWERADASAIAARLAALLPPRHGSAFVAAAAREAPAPSRTFRQAAMVLVLLAAMLAGLMSNFGSAPGAAPSHAISPAPLPVAHTAPGDASRR